MPRTAKRRERRNTLWPSNPRGREFAVGAAGVAREHPYVLLVGPRVWFAVWLDRVLTTRDAGNVLPEPPWTAADRNGHQWTDTACQKPICATAAATPTELGRQHQTGRISLRSRRPQIRILSSRLRLRRNATATGDVAERRMQRFAKA
jgi:hypothetical protein